ncbi:hypothetical protein [Paracoccus liaowanqingii]|uniref:hypothetical protein n=1 Tax=Paracoccus liaowanqingii TaxID=2560053 RepID=UPI00159B92AF|nr:hypothetical protein [Paracoccus liaowanqingii]
MARIWISIRALDRNPAAVPVLWSFSTNGSIIILRYWARRDAKGLALVTARIETRAV